MTGDQAFKRKYSSDQSWAHSADDLLHKSDLNNSYSLIRESL